MEFIERQVQFPRKKKLTMVDINNVPLANEPETFVNIERDEGIVTQEGTIIDTEVMNKGNWRDDKTLSFEKLGSSDPIPIADLVDGRTQIYTKNDGSTWVLPPGSGALAKELAAGSVVKVNNVKADINISFNSSTGTLSIDEIV